MQKKIISIEGNSQKLDGGAMFGNAPKAMWEKWIEVDKDNLIPLSCRAMLVQEENRNILFETGIGAFFPPKLKERYGIVEQEHILLKSLAKYGLKDTDIDIIVLSHLHFDHAGGLLSAWQEDKPYELLFPNAKYIVSQSAFNRAKNPHPRDKASFIPDLNNLLEKSGRLELIEGNTTSSLGEEYYFHFSNGHTPGMILTEVKNTNLGTIIFAADLIPGVPWVHLPITMGYDRFAEIVIDEKKDILNYALKNSIKLFYTHDSKVSISNIDTSDKNKFCAKNPIS